MTLVAVSMSPVKQNNRVAENFMQKLKYSGGGMIMISGSVPGTVIAAGSSAATLQFPPAFQGVPVGLMIIGGSVATGGGLLVSADHDLNKKLTTTDRMTKLSSGNHQTDIWYDDCKETMKSAQNTNKKCPQEIEQA
ncbi:MAG: hypothetical protein ACO3A4_02650 [Silvanigrellaceae bacterium]